MGTDHRPHYITIYDMIILLNTSISDEISFRSLVQDYELLHKVYWLGVRGRIPHDAVISFFSDWIHLPIRYFNCHVPTDNCGISKYQILNLLYFHIRLADHLARI